jgi:Spy/CpxP family protein refolding chaperone
MKKKLIAGLMVSCVIMFSVTTIYAQKRNFNHSRMKFHSYMVQQNMIPAQMILKMKEKIKLSEKQIKKINSLYLDFKKSAIDVKAKISVLNLKLETCFSDKKISKNKVASVIKELGTLKTSMEIAHINHLLDVRSILTAEQLTLLEKLKQERRKSMWHKRRDSFKRNSHR